MGTIYLIHFTQPYKHARHYLGWASNLSSRLQHHRQGNGARLMQVIRQAGISWSLARTWAGDRKEERRLKNWHNAPELCPICNPKITHYELNR